MKNPLRNRGGISGMRRPPAKTALVLTIVFMSLLAATQSVHARTFSVLYTFTGKHGDGGDSQAQLVGDSAGNLYGTTSQGGGSADDGTVFKLTKAGKETVLYKFCSVSCSDGSMPDGGVVRDAAGNLYGTTVFGGAHGAGAVFKVTKKGKEKVLYSFCSVTNCTDGAEPNGGLVLDAAGNLYGTTASGGNMEFCGEGCGVVFQISKTGKETVLYSFCSVANCADGSFEQGGGGYFPEEWLVRDAAGSLYGTTPLGGNLACGDGCGVIFKVDTAGNETVLYNFCSAAKCADGSHPGAGLIQDSAGNLYGTTTDGGEHVDYGTVFKLDTSGNETVLYSFPGHPSVGEVKPSALVLDAAGNLYGTTEFGGSFHEGSVFEVTHAGPTHTLYSFKERTDGGQPQGGVLLDGAGNLYGTTAYGGNLNDCEQSGCGTVFKLTH